MQRNIFQNSINNILLKSNILIRQELQTNKYLSSKINNNNNNNNLNDNISPFNKPITNYTQ